MYTLNNIYWFNYIGLTMENKWKMNYGYIK